MAKEVYYSDRKLDIVILGGMGKGIKNHNLEINKAVESILASNSVKVLLERYNVKEQNIEATHPEEWQNPNIADGVFEQLDGADLVIVNICPKRWFKEPPANVMYEIALVHALGIPCFILSKANQKVPFYLSGSRNYPVRKFKEEYIKDVLAEPIKRLLDTADNTPFAENIVSRFYDGLPIVDISAVVGLATGYYMNFVRRLLKDGGFISKYPEKIKKLIVVLPIDIFNTFEQDWTTVTNYLKVNGYELVEEKLAPIETDKQGAIWFYHSNGIIIDIPRTIYPLRLSPHLLSLQTRIDQNAIGIKEDIRNEILSKSADKLLFRIEQIIRYHIRKDQENVRGNLLKVVDFGSLLNEL